MREFDVVPLTPESARAYRRWLDGDPAGIPLAAETPERLAYVVSPGPWAFWIGVGLVSERRLTPVLTFKNAVPVMDLLGDLGTPEPLTPPAARAGAAPEDGRQAARPQPGAGRFPRGDP